jgi:glycosyltransferase involved in cell wall biosynthesis
MSAARNLGIRHAAGKYIAHLDGDNVWLPRKLEEQVATLESHPEAAMVYGPLERWFDWKGAPDMARGGLRVFGAGKTGVHPFRETLVQPPHLVALFLRDSFCEPDGIMIRKQALEAVGGCEEEFRGLYEDAVVMVKVCLDRPAYVSGTIGQRYRMHPDSCSYVSAREGANLAAGLKYLNWVEAYLRRKGVRDRSVWRALRSARRRLRYGRWYRWADREHLAWRTKTALRGLGQSVLPPRANDWLLSQWRALFPPRA